MSFKGEIKLDEDQVKQIVRERMEEQGFTILDEHTDPIKINVSKGSEQRQGYRAPHLRHITVRVELD